MLSLTELDLEKDLPEDSSTVTQESKNGSTISKILVIPLEYLVRTNGPANNPNTAFGMNNILT